MEKYQGSPIRCQLQGLFQDKVKDSCEEPPKKRMKFKHQVSDEVPIHMPGSPLPPWMVINKIADNIELNRLNKLRSERGRSIAFHNDWTI